MVSANVVSFLPPKQVKVRSDQPLVGLVITLVPRAFLTNIAPRLQKDKVRCNNVSFFNVLRAGSMLLRWWVLLKCMAVITLPN